MNRSGQAGTRGAGCLTGLAGFFAIIFAISIIVVSPAFIVVAIVLWFVIRFAWRKLCVKKPDSPFVKRFLSTSPNMRKVLGALLSVFVALVIATGANSSNLDKQQEPELETASLVPASSLAVEASDEGADCYYLEYDLKTVEASSLLKASSDKVLVSADGNVDLSTVGKQNVAYTMRSGSHEKTEDVTFIVRDTQAPAAKINQQTVTVESGSEFDPNSNFSVSDPVDGALDQVQNKPDSTGQVDGKDLYQSGWYLLSVTSPTGEATDTVDTSKTGTYTVRITGSDENGNALPDDSSFQVVVTAPAKQSAASGEATSSPSAAGTSASRDDSQKTVFITPKGKKYHFDEGCNGLTRAKSISSTTLANAKAQGYTPCAKCAR